MSRGKMPESVSERHRAWERGWCSRSEEVAEGYGRWRRDRGGEVPETIKPATELAGILMVWETELLTSFGEIQEPQSGFLSESICSADLAIRFDVVAGSRQVKPKADSLAAHRGNKQIKPQSAFADVG